MPKTILNWNLHNSSVLSDGKVYEELSRYEATAANFGTIAQGGFDAGSITLTDVPEDVVMDAVRGNWLMKEVRVTSGRGERPYEAFVSEVKGKVGRHTYGRDIAPMYNKALISFYEPDSGHPGKRKLTNNLSADKLDSQAKYGIKEGQLDLTAQGTINRTQAQSDGNTFLNLSGVPRKFDLEMGGDTPVGPNTLTLNLRGYWFTTQFRYINFKIKTALELASIVYRAGNNQSLLTLINPDGSKVLQFLNQSVVSNIQTTGISIIYNANGSFSTAQDFFAAICKYGNASKKRSYAQLWEDRILHLAVRGTTASYFTRSDDSRSWAKNKAPIPAYMVRAGNFILTEDYLGDVQSSTDDTEGDGRASFIYQTNYNDLTGTCKTTEQQNDPLTVIVGRVVNKQRVIDA